MRHLYASLIALTCTLPALAGHYSGGNITYTCDGTGQYTVTLQLFVDCSGAAIIPQDITFSSDCGTTYTVLDLPPSEGAEVSQLCDAQLGNSTCNGGPLPGMRLYEFTTVQELASCDDWTISWNICCRASSINLDGVPGMYIETTVHNATVLCEDSPVFTEDALPYVCVNQPVSYNFGVSDDEGDSLAYTFLDARTWVGNTQTPVTYQPGFTGTEPIPGIALDAATGQVTFTPTLTGYYIVAVEVSAYNDAGELTSTVVRDILFVVIDCSNTNPDADSGMIQNLSGSATLDGDYALLACGSPSFCFEATISDADDLQSLTLTSNVDQVLNGAAFEVTGTNPATGTVCWEGQGASPGTYVFTINATDDACPQPASQILSYSITISEGPNAGSDVAVSLCVLEPPSDLTPFLSPDADAGGTFTEVAPGEYIYTVDAVGDCQGDTATLLLGFNQAPYAGEDATATYCESEPFTDLFPLLGGSPQTGGEFTEIAPGTHIYVVEGIAPCVPDTATLTLIEVQTPDAGLDNAIAVCANGDAVQMLDSLLGTPSPGGAWTGPNGNPHPLAFDPAVDPPGIYCHVVDGTAPCANAIACLTITLLEPNDPICLGTSVHPVVMDDPALFPNPSRGTLTFTEKDLRLVEVLDAQGRIVAQPVAQQRSGRVDVLLPTGLPNGRYMLRTIGSGAVQVRPFELMR